MKHYMFLLLLVILLVSFRYPFRPDEPQVLIFSISSKSLDKQKVDGDVKKLVDSFRGGVSFSACEAVSAEYRYLFNAQYGTTYLPQHLQTILEKLKNQFPGCSLKMVNISESSEFCKL